MNKTTMSFTAKNLQDVRLIQIITYIVLHILEVRN